MKHHHTARSLPIPGLETLQSEGPRDLAVFAGLLHRGRRSLKQLLFGGPIVGVSLGLICAYGFWRRHNIVSGLELFVVVGLVFGLPLWLFARAGLRDLERLVRDGEAVSGVVETAGQFRMRTNRSNTSMPVIGVTYETRSDGRFSVDVPVPCLDFVRPSTDVVVMVHSASPKVVGVFAPGQPDGTLSFYLSMSAPRPI